MYVYTRVHASTETIAHTLLLPQSNHRSPSAITSHDSDVHFSSTKSSSDKTGVLPDSKIRKSEVSIYSLPCPDHVVIVSGPTSGLYVKSTLLCFEDNPGQEFHLPLTSQAGIEWRR